MRVSISQLAMAVALIALLIVFWLSNYEKRFDTIVSLDFSPDGTKIVASMISAVDRRDWNRWPKPERISYLVDASGVTSPKLLLREKMGESITRDKLYAGQRATQFLPNGKLLLVSGSTVYLDFENEPDDQVSVGHNVDGMVISRSGAFAAIYGGPEYGDRKLSTLDLRTGKVFNLHDRIGCNENLGFAFEGAESLSNLVLFEGQRKVVAFNFQTGRFVLPDASKTDQPASGTPSRSPLTASTFPDYSQKEERSIRKTGEILRLFEKGNSNAVGEIGWLGTNVAAISPDGKLVALGGYDNRVKLFEFDTGREIQKWRLRSPRGYWQLPIVGFGVWVFLIMASKASGVFRRPPAEGAKELPVMLEPAEVESGRFEELESC